MISTPLPKLTIGILCFLLFVSASAMDRHNNERLIDKMFQIPVDTPDVSVSQNSTYLMPGQEIEITVQTCQNKDRIVKLTIGDYDIPFDKNGTAVVKRGGGSLGMHKIDVKITFLDSNNERHVKTHTVEYEVGQANANIDEGKLNLLYIGVDNPLYIYASGGGDSKIRATIKGGGSTLTKTEPGLWIVRANTVTDTCIIYVYVDNKLAGAKSFRVVNLPVPAATIGNHISGSRIPAKEFASQQGVNITTSKDFPFKVNYKVVGFTIKILVDSTASKSFTSSDSRFSPDLKKHISQLKPGSVIVIDDITVEESTVRKIKLPALVYFIE